MIYWCVGNGQMHQAHLQEQVGAINAMHDQQIILRGGDEMNGVNRVRRLTPL